MLQFVKFITQGPKRSANIAEHGFDPAQFEEAFSFDRYATAPTKPSRTGRARFLLIGTWLGEAVVVVIVSPLGTEASPFKVLRDLIEAPPLSRAHAAPAECDPGSSARRREASVRNTLCR